MRWQARQPIAIVLCGVSGSGKSVLARLLSERSGFPHVDSDVVRKRLAGLKPSQRAQPGHYSKEFPARTYDRLADVATENVTRAGGVIVDARFRRQRHRDQFVAQLASTGLVPVFVECIAPENVLEERVRRRLDRGGDPSDARPSLIEEQLEEFDPFPSAGFVHVSLETTRPPEELLNEVEDAIDRLRPPAR